MRTSSVFESRHFTLHTLEDGVFAAVAADGGHAICNAGVVELGGQILVYDTFLTPHAAQELRAFVVQAFGRPPDMVINSHYHNDHIWGNQVFAPGSLIISSAVTRALIATEGMEELRWNSANAAQRLEAQRAQYQDAADEQQRQDLLLWIGEYEGIVEALPRLAVTLPGITFTGQLELHGAKRDCRLITFEGGHTASDTVLYLPLDGIVFMSDLLFVDFHPYLADGDPLMLLKALKEIATLDAARFVPGHGRVGTLEDVKLLIEYLEHCMETAQRLAAIGEATEEQINSLVIPEPYRRWRMLQFYRTNLNFICHRL